MNWRNSQTWPNPAMRGPEANGLSLANPLAAAAESSQLPPGNSLAEEPLRDRWDRWARGFFGAVAGFLALTGGVKLWSVLQETRVLGVPDPLWSWLTVRQVVFAAAVLELGVAVVLWRHRTARWAPGLVLWLVAFFGAYRLSLWGMGIQGHCRCLGQLADWLPKTGPWLDYVMVGSLAIMGLGSVWLILTYRQCYKHNMKSQSGNKRVIQALTRLVVFGHITLQPYGANSLTDSPDVAAFKRHLATIPCYQEIIFSESDCNNNITRTYYAAVCGADYAYRSLEGQPDLSLPISATNRNRSSIYVGRYGDKHWRIAGYDLFIDSSGNTKAMSVDGSSYVFVNEVMSFGFQHVQAGTFVWQGDHFTVKPSQFARELGQNEDFQGRIVVEGGRVKRMIIDGAGICDYEYGNEGEEVPRGLPIKISRITAEGYCFSRLVIHRLIPQAGKTASDLFDPYQRIQPDIAKVSLVSNAAVVTIHPKNPKLRNTIYRRTTCRYYKSNSWRKAHSYTSHVSFLRIYSKWTCFVAHPASS